MTRTTLTFCLTLLSALAIPACDNSDSMGDGANGTDGTDDTEGADDTDVVEGSSGGNESQAACPFGYPETEVTCRNLECAEGPKETAVVTVVMDELDQRGLSDLVEIIEIEPDAAIGDTYFTITYHVHDDWFSSTTYDEEIELQGDTPTAAEEAAWREQVGILFGEGIGPVVSLDEIEAAIAACDPSVTFDRCAHSQAWNGMAVEVPDDVSCLPRIKIDARSGATEFCGEPDPDACDGLTGG